MTRQTMMTADCTAWKNIATGMMRVSGKSSVDDAGRSAGLSAQRSPEQINEHHDDYYKGGKGQKCSWPWLYCVRKKWRSTSSCPVSSADQRQALRQHVSWQAICLKETKSMTTAMANFLARRYIPEMVIQGLWKDEKETNMKVQIL